MPPLVLFQTQTFFSSLNTAVPAASSSPICHQSMQTNAIAPSRQVLAAAPSVSVRNAVNASLDISPAHMANSRWRIGDGAMFNLAVVVFHFPQVRVALPAGVQAIPMNGAGP